MLIYWAFLRIGMNGKMYKENEKMGVSSSMIYGN